jgi:hypothetical protein
LSFSVNQKGISAYETLSCNLIPLFVSPNQAPDRGPSC